MAVMSQLIQYNVSAPAGSAPTARWQLEAELGGVLLDYRSLQVQLKYAGQSSVSIDVPNSATVFDLVGASDQTVRLFYRARDRAGALLPGLTKTIATFAVTEYDYQITSTGAGISLSGLQAISWGLSGEVTLRGVSRFANRNGARSATAVYDPDVVPGVTVTAPIAGGTTQQFIASEVSFAGLNDPTMSVSELTDLEAATKAAAEQSGRAQYPGVRIAGTTSTGSIPG